MGIIFVEFIVGKKKSMNLLKEESKECRVAFLGIILAFGKRETKARKDLHRKSGLGKGSRRV